MSDLSYTPHLLSYNEPIYQQKAMMQVYKL